MNDPHRVSVSEADAVTDERLAKAEEFIEEEEGAANKFRGAMAVVVTLAAVAMSVFHLYAAAWIVPTQELRYIHVAFVLFLCFLAFPIAHPPRHPPTWWDWVAAALAVGIAVYAIWGGDDFTDRNTSPGH